MIIKIMAGDCIRNAHVQKETPHPETATFLGCANSEDIFDEHEYNLYVRKRDGVVLAVPRPVR